MSDHGQGFDEAREAFLDRVIGPLPPGEESVPPAEEPSASEITDDVMADRYFRRLQYLEDEETRDQAKLDAWLKPYLDEMQPYMDWMKRRQDKRQRTRLYVEGQLRRYYDYLVAEGTVYKPKQRKSHTPHELPHGSLRSRWLPDAYQISDQDAFREWSQRYGFVTFQITPLWNQAKQTFSVEPDGRVYATLERDGTVELVPVDGVRITRLAGEHVSIVLKGATLHMGVPEEMPDAEPDESDGDSQRDPTA